MSKGLKLMIEIPDEESSNSMTETQHQTRQSYKEKVTRQSKKGK